MFRWGETSWSPHTMSVSLSYVNISLYVCQWFYWGFVILCALRIYSMPNCCTFVPRQGLSWEDTTIYLYFINY